MVNILEGSRSFELQIWWELPPRSVGVYPARERNVQSRGEWEEEGESPTRASNYERSLEKKRKDERKAEKTVEKGERDSGVWSSAASDQRATMMGYF